MACRLREVKERREPWYWSDHEVDPWSWKFSKISFTVLFLAFVLANVISAGILNASLMVERRMVTLADLLLIQFLVLVGYQISALLYGLAELIVAQRRKLSLSYVAVWGSIYDPRKRKFIKGPGLVGPIFQVRLHPTVRDVQSIRAVLKAGPMVSFFTTPVAFAFVLIPTLPDFVRHIATGVAAFSLGIGISRLLPYRVSVSQWSDGYLLHWIKRHPEAVERHLAQIEQNHRYLLCAPRDWELSVILAKHPSPEDYPMRQILRLMYTLDRGDLREYGLILEDSLSRWPRGKLGNNSEELLCHAAVFFSQIVDDQLRAQHYAKRVTRSLRYPHFGLFAFDLTKLVRSGKAQEAEMLVRQMQGFLRGLTPAAREYYERQYKSALESGPPQFTAAEWNEFCQSRLGDA